MQVYEKAVLVLLGGVFGWLLGKLPAHWVYAIMALAVIAALVVFTQ